ncbi:MAG: hypothetical protein HZB53_06160 [Chloroflexi bacterium]|nr:hypothetical protein [Chloroflexota bacterium]
MNAARLKGRISIDRRLIVDHLPAGMAPGAVEVIVLQADSPKPAKRPKRRAASHPAFGIWANRTDIAESAAYAAELRQRLETRSNGRD